MDAALPEGWGEFAVAAAGATAALAGLIIVAISVNVKEILAQPVTTRGAQSTVASLVLGLVASLLLLVPRQPGWALGLEVLVVTAPALAVQVGSVSAAVRFGSNGESGHRVGIAGFIVLLAAAQFAPFVAAALLLLAGFGAGLFVLAAGIVLVVIASMIGAWVLLVEVLR